jgi:hypothetical protein
MSPHPAHEALNVATARVLRRLIVLLHVEGVLHTTATTEMLDILDAGLRPFAAVALVEGGVRVVGMDPS